MKDYSESEFRRRVQDALEVVRKILHLNRTPSLAENSAHRWEDKFVLAEFVVNTMNKCFMNTLNEMGVTEKILGELQKWAETRSVSLRVSATEKCKFLRWTEREERSWYIDSLHVKHETITKIKEWFWQFDVEWKLLAFQGNSPENGIQLAGRGGSCELMTTVDSTPHPEVVVRPDLDVNITWLLHHSRLGSFHIDREAASCHTPRRNTPVEEALRQAEELEAWGSEVRGYFEGTLWPKQITCGCRDCYNPSNCSSSHMPYMVNPHQAHSDRMKHHGKCTAEGALCYFSISFVDYGSTSASGMFVPALPVLPIEVEPDLKAFTEGHVKEIQRYGLARIEIDLRQDVGLKTAQEGRMMFLCGHIPDLAKGMQDGVDYLEKLLYRQLESALGKVLTVSEFREYMEFHNHRMFRKEYRPKVFAHAIRRPMHEPEGVLSIESPGKDAMSEPLLTVLNKSVASRPMKFALDASTKVSFLGNRYLHGMVMHAFAGVSELSLSLNARARQFSSYIVMLGTIASADLFLPKFAIVVENKDDLKIPLDLETIPTAQEFKAAVESLSPEQERFAKAFRAMQLSSTLFAVCVVHIKPTLERCLGVPDGSFTKKIDMTQNLLRLLQEYQIPPDLLAYNGPSNASGEERLAAVKAQISAVEDLILEEKMKELRANRAETVLDLSSVRGNPRLYDWEETGLRLTLKSSTPLSVSCKPSALAGQTLDILYTPFDQGELFVGVTSSTSSEYNSSAAYGVMVATTARSTGKWVAGIQSETGAFLVNAGAILTLGLSGGSKFTLSCSDPSWTSSIDLPVGREWFFHFRTSAASFSVIGGTRGGLQPQPPQIKPPIIEPKPVERLREIEEEERDEEPVRSKFKESKIRYKRKAKDTSAKKKSSRFDEEKSMVKRAMVVESAFESLADYEVNNDFAQESSMPTAPAELQGEYEDFAMEPQSEEFAREVEEDAAIMDDVEAKEENEVEDNDQGNDEGNDENKDEDNDENKEVGAHRSVASEGVDYTKIPALLDERCEALDADAQLRPTTIKPTEHWVRQIQKHLLSRPEVVPCGPAEITKEKNRAFDLLDALTKSGAVPIEHADLHVVIGSTHCFGKSLVDTLVQDNMNPIEKVERSMLIVASTLHNRPASQLITPEAAERAKQFSPQLFQ